MSIIYKFRRFQSMPNGRRIARVAVVSIWIAAGIPASPPAGEFVAAAAAVDDRADDLKSAIAKAKPGDTIVLAAGTYKGPIELPAGVGIRGAGRNATIVDARAAAFGIAAAGGSNAEIADLTVLGAKQTNIKIEQMSNVRVRRVRSVGAINGITFLDVDNGRIENAIVDENRYGVALNGGSNNVVVNCTLANDGSIGISLPKGTRPVVFNNVVVGGSTCLYLGDKVVEPRVDHNVYFGQTIGKLSEQTAKISLNDWKYITNQDIHSVSLFVEFRDRRVGDYRAANSPIWSLERASTSDWGVAEFAGATAPATDIDGAARIGAVDAGAFEIAFKPSRPADGEFEIRGDRGTSSAGLFDRKNRLVFYLFHESPLAKGKYRFWAPRTDDWGRPIRPGKYELRLVQADLNWRYMGYIGDTGEPYPASLTAPVAPALVAYDRSGRLLMGHSWSEDGTNLRGYSVEGKIDWYFEGSSDIRGLTFDSAGCVIIARNQGDKVQLSRIDPQTGSPAPSKLFPRGSTTIGIRPVFQGLAELDGKLFITDASRDEVKATAVDSIDFVETFVVAAPSHPVVDPKNHLLWMISGKKVIAINTQGRVLVESTPVESPAALSFYETTLAVASRRDGKIHLFDASTPTELKPIRVLGRGDGPFGPYSPDRFTFQSAPRFPGSRVEVAVGPDGMIGVIDGNRLLAFNAKNELMWSTYGVFGNGMTPSFADDQRLFDDQGRRSMRVDEKKGEWKPEAFWSTGVDGEFLGEFFFDGERYGVFRAIKNAPSVLIYVGRYEKYRLKGVFELLGVKNRYFARFDQNGDGVLDESDRAEPVAPPTTVGASFGRFNTLYPGGDVLAINAGGWYSRWRVSKNARGVPVYLPDRVVVVPKPKDGIISPYTHVVEPTAAAYGIAPFEDGTFVANVNYRTSPGGTGLSNTAGTDFVGVDSSGAIRWIHPYSEKHGIVGAARLGSVAIAGIMETSEIIVVDHDGLGMNGFTLPAFIHYPGYYLDHTEAVRGFRGADGAYYALIADNYNGRSHWWRLEGDERTLKTTVPIMISTDLAAEIARSPRRSASTPVASPPAIVRIPRLPHPFVIDGDLEKWRKVGIVPQIILTPDTSPGGVTDARDASAIIRLAYEGKSIYVQVIRFDDVVCFHQPVALHFKQDCVEMCINGFTKGFKFDVADTVDAGPMILRQRFFGEKLEMVLPRDHAPLSIKVLPTAKDVSERVLIENVLGENLADCKTIIYEFKLPIDEITYQGDVKSMFPLRPGQTFWLGFMIDDNDNPGTDVQNLMVWPATYGTFRDAEAGARAVLD